MQVGGQGWDMGDNYRSALWTYGDDQLAAAKRSLAAQEKTGHDACPAPRRPVNLPNP